MICDWWISIRFVSFCVSRFIACDRIGDYSQTRSSVPPMNDNNNEFIIRKLNPLLVVDFRLISAFLHA